MDLKEIFNIKSPELFNCELDKFLNTTNIIPKELVYSLDDAYSYNQATTVNWVISKLKILKVRIDNNESFELEGHGYLDKFKFYNWIKTKYPHIYKNIL